MTLLRAWDSPEQSGDGRWGWVAVALLAVHMVLAWVLRHPGILTGQDDAHYLLLAEALRDFRYVDLFRVDLPAHTRYPPFYPAVLALWEPVVGGRFDGLVALNILLSAAGLGLLYRVVSLEWGPLFGVAVLAPMAVNSSLLDLAGEVRPESLYFFLTMVVLHALMARNPGGRWLVVGGGAAILGALTRSAGVAIVCAVALHWLLARRKVATPVFLVVSALTVGMWLLWSATAPEQYVGRSYAADLTYDPVPGESRGMALLMLDRLSRNVGTFLSLTVYQLGVPNIRPIDLDRLVVTILLGAALLVGLVVLWKRWRIAALYLAASVGLLLVWPWVLGRFLVPLLPLLLLAILLGLGTGATWIVSLVRSRTMGTGSDGGVASARRGMPGRVGWVIVLGFVLATTLWISGRTGRSALGQADCQRGSVPPHASCVWPDQASYFDALRFIDRELPEDAVFLSAKPEPLYYYIRRLSAPIDPALRQGPDDFLPFLREFGTDHVLLGSLQGAEIGPLLRLLEANCEELALVRKFPRRTYLFRLREVGEEPGEDACLALADYRVENRDRDFQRNI